VVKVVTLITDSKLSSKNNF